MNFSQKSERINNKVRIRMYVETPISTNQNRDYSNKKFKVAKKFEVWRFFANISGTTKAIKKIFGRKISGQMRRLLKKKSRKKI